MGAIAAAKHLNLATAFALKIVLLITLMSIIRLFTQQTNAPKLLHTMTGCPRFVKNYASDAHPVQARPARSYLQNRSVPVCCCARRANLSLQVLDLPTISLDTSPTIVKGHTHMHAC